MDEQEFKARAQRLREVGKLLDTLPSEVRALAFPLVSDYIVGTRAGASSGSKHQRASTPALAVALTPVDDRDTFFRSFDHEKPADNAKLLAAWHYSQFGSEPFTAEEVKALAAAVGITIPDRVDKTLAVARENGKNLFQRTGKSTFRPTVHGEAYLKSTYKIAKGTKKKAGESAGTES